MTATATPVAARPLAPRACKRARVAELREQVQSGYEIDPERVADAVIARLMREAAPRRSL